MRRVCARVAVVDGEGTLLLVRVHDREPPHTGWLVVPGGGLEDGEKGEDVDLNGFGLRIWPNK